MKKEENKKIKREVVGVLADLRSVYNTASCFRTAEGLGVSKLYLVGTTPGPRDRFGRERKDFAKVALSAEKMVNYEYSGKAEEIINKLKKEGFLVVGVEQDFRAENLFDFVRDLDKQGRESGKNSKSGIKNQRGERERDFIKIRAIKKIALVFGNETEGLADEILDSCDKITEIPMRGKKESLNVAVVFGIAVYSFKNLR